MAHTEHHGVNHETTDAHVGGVVRLLVITTGFLVVSFALMAWMLSSFKASREAADVKPAPIAQRAGDRQPPLPRLQTTPYADLKSFQASETQVLETYAWVDQANGVVRVPIAEAIRRVATNGLPAFAPVAPGGAAAGGPAAAPVAPGGAAAGGPAAAPVH